MFMGEPIGQVSDPESCCSSGDQGGAVVGLEAPLRTNRDDLVAIRELPGLGSLHEGLMGDEFLRCLGRPMHLDIGRTRDELPMDRADASCNQVGVLKIANPYRTVVTLRDEINKAIAVAGLDVKPRVASCHFREDGREVSRPQGKRHSNTQAAAKVTGGQDRFPGHVDLGADPGCIVPERGSGFSESSPAGGSREQLDTKFFFKPDETTTDDRLGHPKPQRSGRNAPGIGNFHECLQLFDIQFGVPRSATQLAMKWYYRIKRRNNTILLRGNVAAGACFPEDQSRSQRQ